MNLIRALTLVIGFFAALSSCVNTVHSFLSLDNVSPEQLKGVLDGNWKEQLIGEVKEQVNSFIKPENQ